jgi:predicted membrane chloride channel (bestrophin family)
MNWERFGGRCTSLRSSTRKAAAVARRIQVHCNLERPPRAASGWYRSLTSLPRSRVLANVRPQVVTALVGSCAVVVLHSILQSVLGDENAFPALSPTPHTFLATALGLMLVFRTNAAYDRYWEGRKIWGGVVNTGYVEVRQATFRFNGRDDMNDPRPILDSILTPYHPRRCAHFHYVA